MILPIDDNMTIGDLQDRFNECFPHLKIEFYSHAHHWKESSIPSEVIDPSKKIGEIRKNHEHGNLEIKSWYQTGRVEQDFKKIFGLNVQIFRNEKGKWHQTVSSDKLTLKEQEQITSSLKEK
jgi:hypothetical protein